MALILALVTATTVNLSPLFDDVLNLAIVVLTGVIAWGVKLAATKLHVDAQGQMAQAVTTALDNGLAYAAHLADVKIAPGLSIDVKNQMAADAANYVVGHYKDWLAKLGIDESKLAETALAKLPH